MLTVMDHLSQASFKSLQVDFRAILAPVETSGCWKKAEKCTHQSQKVWRKVKRNTKHALKHAKSLEQSLECVCHARR